MSNRDWKILFEDINEAINKIEQYTADFVFDDFVISTMVVDAVVRNLEIIGEASKNIPSEIRIKFPSIP